MSKYLRQCVQISRIVTTVISSIIFGLSHPVSARNSVVSDIVIVFYLDNGFNNSEMEMVKSFLENHNYELPEKYIDNIRSLKTSPLAFDLFAFKKYTAFINIYSVPMRKNVFTASIKTRPPTVHDGIVENELIELVRNKLNGSIISITYDKNPESSQRAFDLTIRSFIESSQK